MQIEWYVRPIITDGVLIPIEPPVWPSGWPLPRVGEAIYNPANISLRVTHIDWFPHGEDDDEPFINIGLIST